MEAFAASKGLTTVSLRYFNVFGPRQNPKGGYAAVIPRWIASAQAGVACSIFGDGLTTRDFCYVGNVVGANLLAGVADPARVNGRAFNIGCGEATTLNELHDMIQELVAASAKRQSASPKYEDFRPGELRHSTASIDRAREVLGYRPETLIREGLGKTVEWYVAHAGEV
jgi:UDP-N-acetylglucosamine 4-epimerase